MVSRTATEAAQLTGFPPKVVPWAPTGQSFMTSAGAP